MVGAGRGRRYGPRGHEKGRDAKDEEFRRKRRDESQYRGTSAEEEVQADRRQGGGRKGGSEDDNNIQLPGVVMIEPLITYCLVWLSGGLLTHHGITRLPGPFWITANDQRKRVVG